MRRTTFGGLIGSIVLVALLAQPAGAALLLPPTLTGETFAGTATLDRSQCNDTGGGTVTYTSSGAAAGPYIGTYVETGKLTFTPFKTSVIPTSFHADFTITSVGATVTGSKTWSGQLPNFRFPWTCTGGLFFIGRPDFAGQLVPAATYNAQIDSQGTVFQGGRFSDSGTSTLVVSEAGLSEDFRSNQTQTTPVAPISKADCQNGGYATFGFKNEGQCIKSVSGHHK